MNQSRELSSSRSSLTTNSTTRNRITRKPQHSGKTSRSKSKDNFETNSISAHFIKSTPMPQSNAEGEERQPALRKFRNVIANESHSKIIGTQREKKREPTPSKSFRELRRNEKTPENKIFEWEIKVAEIEDKMMEERKLREKYEKGFTKNNKEILQLKSSNEKLELQKATLLKNEKQMQEKIRDLEGNILENETNLLATKTNLQKLRQTIKENRLLELQSENRKIKKQLQESQLSFSKLRLQIQELNKKIKQLTQKNRELTRKTDTQRIQKMESMKEQYLNKEIEKLKRRLENTKDEKERFLDAKIQLLQKEAREALEEKKGLQIKFYMMERSKNEEILSLKRKKQAELKNIRVKCSKLMKQVKDHRLIQSDIIPQKKEEHFSFELSPQK